MRVRETIPKPHTWKSYQGIRKKTATLGTAHVLRNVSNNVTHLEIQPYMNHKIYPQNRRKIIYSRNMVCFRYVIVYILYKSDDDDDDDDDELRFNP